MPLKKISISLFICLQLTLLITGCDKREEILPPPIVVSFQNPSEGDTIIDDSEELQLRLSTGTRQQSLLLTLNGVDITQSLKISGATGIIVSNFENPLINSALVLGSNTLVASRVQLGTNDFPVLVDGNPVILVNQSLFFTYDPVNPRIQITDVSIAAPDVAGADGRPQSGQSIIVSGNLIDPTPISKLSFIDPTGAEIFLGATSAPNLIGNRFNNVTKKFSVTLPNYPDINVITSSAHYSYKIEDRVEQKRTESFVASGTPIAKAMVTQLNETLFDVINPLVNTFLVDIISTLEVFNVFNQGVAVTYDGSDIDVNSGDNSPATIRGQRVEDPTNYQESGLRFSTLSADLNAPFFDAPYNTIPNVLCTSTPIILGKSWFIPEVNKCVVYIQNIEIVNPSFDVNLLSPGGLKAKMGLYFDKWAISIQIAGLHKELQPFGLPPEYTYIGNFHTTLALTAFEISSMINIKANPQNLFVDIKRESGFDTSMSQLLQQPALTNTGCDICGFDFAGPAELVYNIGAIKIPANLQVAGLSPQVNAFLANESGRSIGKFIVDAMGFGLEISLGTLVDGLLADSAMVSPMIYNEPNSNAGEPDREYVSTVAASAVTPLRLDFPFYNIVGAHLDFSGAFSTLPANFDKGYELVNGGLGSLFTPQNTNFVDFFPNKLPGGQGKPLDFIYNISANSINQNLLAKHQTGWFEENDMLLDKLSVFVCIDDAGLEFYKESQDLPVAGTVNNPLVKCDVRNDWDAITDVRLKVETKEPPFVEFKGLSNSSGNIGGCVSTLCGGNGNSNIPGSVNVVLNNINLKMIDKTNGATVTLFDVNADIVLTVSVGMENGLPAMKPFNDFVNVKVISANSTNGKPNALVGSKLNEFISVILNKYLKDFNLSTGTIVDAKDDLFKGAGACIINNGPNKDVCTDPINIADPFKSDFFLDYSSLIASALPREYGLEFRWFEIDQTGAYFTMALDVLDAKLSGFSCPPQPDPNAAVGSYPPTQPTYFRAYCLKQ